MIKFFKNIFQALSLKKQIGAIRALLKELDGYLDKFLKEQERRNKIYRFEVFFFQANGFYMNKRQYQMFKSYLDGKTLYSARRRTGKTTFITTLALFESTYYDKDFPIFCEAELMVKNTQKILKNQENLLSSSLYEKIKIPKVISLDKDCDKARGYRRLLADLDYNGSNNKMCQFFYALSHGGECFVIEGF
jgi:hypothetical protein